MAIDKKDFIEKFEKLPEYAQQKIDAILNEMIIELDEVTELKIIRKEMANGEFVKHEDIDWEKD